MVPSCAFYPNIVTPDCLMPHPIREHLNRLQARLDSIESELIELKASVNALRQLIVPPANLDKRLYDIDRSLGIIARHLRLQADSRP